MARPRQGQVGTAAATQPINNFTRISKGPALSDSAIKKSITVEPSLTTSTTTTITKTTAAATTTTTSRKRKATTTPSPVQDAPHPRVTRRNHSFAPSSDEEDGVLPAKRACRRQEVAPVAAVKTPTKQQIVTKGKRTARAAASRKETANRASESTIIAKTKKTVQTKLDGAFAKLKKGQDVENKNKDKNALPIHLVELVDLHKSFMKTIMIHFAHNGTNAPVDVRTISPSTVQSWGKRAVTIEDIRRCIAIQSSAKNNVTSPFIVTDYGRGKICIELASERTSPPLDEGKVCRQFEENLQALVAEKSMDGIADVEIPVEKLSLNDLPKAEIINRHQGVFANPELAKGQRALAELKSGVVNKLQLQQEKKKPTQTAAPLLNSDGSKMSLLDRLRLKQLAKSTGPLPPSGPELQRRAALNRVGDVAATISMLSLSNSMSLPRQAFTMSAILEKLKDSLRTPLSREEGSDCIRLIANEVAPEWLKVVTIGGRENVVVQRNGQPVDNVIKERVQKLMG